MLSMTEDLKTKLLTEIAKLLVENIPIRNAIKNHTENNANLDAEILLEIKTLAQRLDMPKGLDNISGVTLLEKAINYLKSSVTLALIDDTKLTTFVKALSSLTAQSPATTTPLTPATNKSNEKEKPAEPVYLNVSGYGNNCGLFAMVLGIKIALENQPPASKANDELSFLMSIDDASLQHATQETVGLGKMLRGALAAALKRDAEIRARRFETFVSYCTAYLIHADFSELDTELEALYKASELEMSVMYKLWAKIMVGKGLDQTRIDRCLEEINTHDVSSEIANCYEQISALLLKIDLKNPTEKIVTLLQSFYAAEEEPILRIIKLRKLYRAAWERVSVSQANEQRREVFNETVRKYFIQQYFSHFEGKLKEDVEADDPNLDVFFIFAIIEAMKFDRHGVVVNELKPTDILDHCRSLFAEYKVTQFWNTKFYPNYCHYLETSNVKIAADELACLAMYWNVQLSIKMRTGKDLKTYAERNAQLLHVSLTNPSEDHWIVVTDKDSLTPHRLLSTSEIKSTRLQPPQLPTAAAPSKPISSTAISTGVRGVFDNTLTQLISNDEFDLQIYRLANYLLKQYTKANRVALFMQQSVDYMRCFFALHQAGKAAMPISPDTDISATILASFLKGGDVDLIISHSRYRRHPFFDTAEAGSRKVFFIDELRAEIDSYPEVKPSIINRDEDLAYIVNTSGSTGVPKQVLVPHRGLKDCTEGHIKVLKITAEDNIAAYADPAFDAHIIEMLIQRTTGANLFIVPSDARRDLIKLSKFYQNHKITIGVFVASMLRQCKREDFPNLRVVICTGEKIDKTIIDEWSGILLIDGYGPAENTIATWLKIVHTIDKSEMHIIPNTQYFIMQKEPDALGIAVKPVKPGEEGELYLAGNGLAIGYTNDELTRARFVEIQHPSGSGVVRVYKTRDVAKQNPDGTLDIVGRLDRQIKVYGRLFNPETIEEIIVEETNKSIQYLYVDAVLNDKGHPEIIAYLEYKGTAPFDITILYHKICTQIAQTFAPTCWVISTNLPKLASGKVNSKELPKLKEPRQRIHGSSQILARNDLEKELTDLFYDKLGISNEVPIYRDDNFFHLGGKSLQATMFLQILRDRYQLRLSYDEFTLIATIELLAHAISRVKANSQLKEIVCLYDEKQETSNTPVILIHSLLGDAVRDYEKLKAVWNYPHSLYVISARGLRNQNDMDNNLYAIAYDYYRAIKEKFPRGLKIIAGWSMGGVLSTIIKYFFQLDGDDSAAVLMIDSESPTTFQAMSSLDYAKFLHHLFSNKLSGQFDLNELPQSIAELSALPKEKQVHVLFDAVEAQLAGVGVGTKKGLLATVRGLLLGVLKFQLDRRIENVRMITASETQSYHANSNLGWPKDKVNTELLAAITGNHDSIMLDNTNVRNVAERLFNFVKRQQDEFLVHRLANNKDWKDFPDIDEENLKYYIPAMGTRNPNTPPVELLKLVKEEFLSTPKKVLLMLGDAGVGKTTFLCWLAKQLQENRKLDSPIVLYIPLGSYEDPLHGLIEAHLRRLGFVDSQIAQLKKHQKFIFILDGYDEIDKGRYQNLYATNHLDEWNAQVITGCRFTYIINAQNYRLSFYPVAKDRVLTEGLSEVTILPFNDSQIEEFIKAYLRNPPKDVVIDEEWRDYRKYIDNIKALPGMWQLISNPFLLRVLMEVLPTIVSEYEQLAPDKRLPITTSKILDAFVAAFWERAVMKLIIQGKLSGRDIRIDYDQFCIDFAKDLKLANLTNVIYRPAVQGQAPSQWEKYFADDPEKIKIREACFLKRHLPPQENKASSFRRVAVKIDGPVLKGEIIGFFHPMLIEYFIGRGIYLEFLLMQQPEDDKKLLQEYSAKINAESGTVDNKYKWTGEEYGAFFKNPQAVINSSVAPAAAETSQLKPPSASAEAAAAAAIVSSPTDDAAVLQATAALSMAKPGARPK